MLTTLWRRDFAQHPDLQAARAWQDSGGAEGLEHAALAVLHEHGVRALEERGKALEQANARSEHYALFALGAGTLFLTAYSAGAVHGWASGAGLLLLCGALGACVLARLSIGMVGVAHLPDLVARVRSGFDATADIVGTLHCAILSHELAVGYKHRLLDAAAIGLALALAVTAGSAAWKAFIS